MKNKNPRYILFFIHNSVSEFYVGLPILWFLKKYMDIRVCFISLDINILNRLKVQDSYKTIINELGESYFGRQAVIKLLLKLTIKQNDIINFSCFSGMLRIEKVFYYLLKDLKKVFFPHSFALYPSDKFIKKEQYEKLLNDRQLDFRKRFGINYHYLFLNREEEKDFYSLRGWDKNHIIGIAAFGYYSEWLLKLGIQKKSNFNKRFTIFIPLRNYNKHALTKENYIFLVKNLFDLMKSFDNYDFIVKFHPRQHDIEELSLEFEKLHNVFVSNENPYKIITECDLTIGFWGSILQDSIALGTPAIEFHIHHTSHPQVFQDVDGEYKSLYEAYDILKRFDNSCSLISYLRILTEDELLKLYNKQKGIFNKIYSIDENIKVQEMVSHFENIFNLKINYAVKIKELIKKD